MNTPSNMKSEDPAALVIETLTRLNKTVTNLEHTLQIINRRSGVPFEEKARVYGELIEAKRRRDEAEAVVAGKQREED